jgi:hypothetical protein
MTKKSATSSFVLAAIALGCWVLMFMAGHDVWHDTGRLDLWRLEGPPYADLRAFIVTFYVLLPVLLAQLAVAVLNARKRRTLEQP